MKTKQSQRAAVANYQENLYTYWGFETEEEHEKKRMVRERRRGQVYRSNGKTWAKKYASHEELARYIDELKQIEQKRFDQVYIDET
ncbi:MULTISPECIES: hypothetical protein [unclassified Enterococcus]|uniref:hypothetical protein n=1 Tax=unclassified Enterococcus TaxID=2608891 RepID=UPI003F246F53